MPIQPENRLLNSQIHQGFGPVDLIECNNIQAFLEGQRSGGKNPENSLNPQKPNLISTRIRAAVQWIKGWVPPEPSEIVAPIDMIFALESQIHLASQSQQIHDREARRLLEESGFDQIYTLKPGVQGLQLTERKKFAGRLDRFNLFEKEQVVIKVHPKTQTRQN